MKLPVQVAVTGAAGQIGYSLLFRLIAGELLGPDQPIVLRLLEMPEALSVLEGITMELRDCASPLLYGIVQTSDPEVAFDLADYVFLIGARPRGPGMERKDLLQANAAIFSQQGRALDAVAQRQVKVLVVGNPANTNALIAQQNALGLAPENFSAMMRLDQHRAISLLATHCHVRVDQVKRVVVWGNHSTTQYPDLSYATVGNRPALQCVEHEWYHQQFIPAIRNRGAEVIRMRGKSSAASAADAALRAMRTWIEGTPYDDWTSMAVLGDRSYGIAAGLVFSYPVTIHNGRWKIVQDLELDTLTQAGLRVSEAELVEERDAIRHLLPTNA